MDCLIFSWGYFYTAGDKYPHCCFPLKALVFDENTNIIHYLHHLQSSLEYNFTMHSGNILPSASKQVPVCTPTYLQFPAKNFG